jgi:hypothetical protein
MVKNQTKQKSNFKKRVNRFRDFLKRKLFITFAAI